MHGRREEGDGPEGEQHEAGCRPGDLGGFRLWSVGLHS